MSSVAGERVKRKGGGFHTGLYWKSWETKSGKRNRSLYIHYKINGKHKSEKVLSGRIKDAITLREQRKTEMNKGLITAEGDRRFAAVAKVWLDSKRTDPGIRDNTIAGYDGKLRKHIDPSLGGLRLSGIKATNIIGFQTELQKKGLSPYTVRGIMAVVRQILNFAVLNEWIPASPAPMLRYGKTTPRSDALNLEEVGRLLDYIQSHEPEWYPLFFLAIVSGMRVNEILAARWRHLNWQAETYAVTENLTRSRVFREPKTPSSKDVVDLSLDLLAAMKQHKLAQDWRRGQARRRNKWSDDPQHEDLIFPTRIGTPLTDAHVSQRVFQRLLKGAGIQKKMTFHGLRHTCGSLLAADGEPEKYIQAQLRHSSSRTTNDFYVHLYPESRKGARRRTDERLARHRKTG